MRPLWVPVEVPLFNPPVEVDCRLPMEFSCCRPSWGLTIVDFLLEFSHCQMSTPFGSSLVIECRLSLGALSLSNVQFSRCRMSTPFESLFVVECRLPLGICLLSIFDFVWEFSCCRSSTRLGVLLSSIVDSLWEFSSWRPPKGAFDYRRPMNQLSMSTPCGSFLVFKYLNN